MPQLNTTPWLMVFLLTWLAMFMYNIKITKMQEPNSPNMNKTIKKMTKNWQWP